MVVALEYLVRQWLVPEEESARQLRENMETAQRRAIVSRTRVRQREVLEDNFGRHPMYTAHARHIVELAKHQPLSFYEKLRRKIAGEAPMLPPTK